MMQIPNGEAAMKSSKPGGKWMGRGIICVALGLGLFACGRFLATDAYNALQIVQVQVLPTGDCTVPGTATPATQSKGILDVYLPDGSYPPYLLPLLVANNLDSVGGTKATEMNNITLTHFTIQLSAPGMTWGSSCPAEFDSEPFTSTLAPGGLLGVGVQIITSSHAQCLLMALDPQPKTDQGPRDVFVTATIFAKGHHGGTDIISAPFVYGVDVCTGCLQTGYSDASLVQYDYPAGYPACAALTGTNPYPGNQCFAHGQDQTILCCGLTNSSGRAVAVCPATPMGSTSTATNTNTSTSTSTTTSP
jgi:hypothetical protein